MKRLSRGKIAHFARTARLGLNVAVLVSVVAFGGFVGGKDFIEQRRLRANRDAHHRTSEAVITGRQVKACFGWRCNNPEYFNGGRGDAGYPAFAQRYCSRSVRTKNCSYILSLDFTNDGNKYSLPASVSKIRFQEMLPNQRLKIEFDFLDPANFKVVGDNQGDADYYAFMILAGTGIFALWLGLGVAVNARRNRRGWGTGGYRQGW